MQSCTSSLSTGLFLLTAYVLLVSTQITASSSQPQEISSQVKPSGSDHLNAKIRHLIRRAVQQDQTAEAFLDGELTSSRGKRVFCNSFGGCRSIKRSFDGENEFKIVASDSVQPTEQETAIVKRVFCNSYGGCRSFKRDPADDIRKAAILKQRNLSKLQRRKRVFCNSFGGCQN